MCDFFNVSSCPYTLPTDFLFAFFQNEVDCGLEDRADFHHNSGLRKPKMYISNEK